MKLKVFIICIIACVTLSACQSAKPVQKAGIIVNDGWYPNEKIIPGKLNKIFPEFSIPESREGIMPNGDMYTIYQGGTGNLTSSSTYGNNGWSIDCRTDALDDKPDCKLTSSKARLYIYYGNASSPKSICILGHDFPGRKGAIRIDKSNPITTDTDGCISGKNINKLFTGNTVTTRAVKWPYDTYIDSTHSIAGLKSAMELVKFISKNGYKLNYRTD